MKASYLAATLSLSFRWAPRRSRLSWCCSLCNSPCHPFFLPMPARELVESQPVMAWKAGRARHMRWILCLLVAWYTYRNKVSTVLLKWMITCLRPVLFLGCSKLHRIMPSQPCISIPLSWSLPSHTFLCKWIKYSHIVSPTWYEVPEDLLS